MTRLFFFTVPGPRQCEIHKGSHDSLRPLLDGASGGPLTHCADESILRVCVCGIAVVPIRMTADTFKMRPRCTNVR